MKFIFLRSKIEQILQVLYSLAENKIFKSLFIIRHLKNYMKNMTNCNWNFSRIVEAEEPELHFRGLLEKRNGWDQWDQEILQTKSVLGWLGMQNIICLAIANKHIAFAFPTTYVLLKLGDHDNFPDNATLSWCQKVFNCHVVANFSDTSICDLSNCHEEISGFFFAELGARSWIHVPAFLAF